MAFVPCLSLAGSPVGTPDGAGRVCLAGVGSSLPGDTLYCAVRLPADDRIEQVVPAIRTSRARLKRRLRCSRAVEYSCNAAWQNGN